MDADIEELITLAELTLRTEALLSTDDQQYDIGAERVKVYLTFLAANPDLARLPQVDIDAALAGRVRNDLVRRIRCGAGFRHIRQYWDWPRGILAVLTAVREVEA